MKRITRSSILALAVGVAVSLSACGGQSQDEKAVSTLKEVAKALNSNKVEGERTKEEVRAWPAKFCSLNVKMTREQIRQVMGEPTMTFNDSNANQDQWSGYNVSLTAFYDIDDKVETLADSTGESNLPCASNRKASGESF